MKWLEKLFGVSKDLVIQDDVFGELKLLEWRNDDKNYWEGKGKFEPYGAIIEYFVETKGHLPPSMQQKEFLRNIVSNYDVYKAQWLQALNDEVKKAWNFSSIHDFDKSFRIVSIQIPKISTAPNWELVVKTAPEIDPNHLYFIKMKGSKVEKINMDG